MSALIEKCRYIARVVGKLQINGYCEDAHVASQVVWGKQLCFFNDSIVVFAGLTDLSLEVVLRETAERPQNPAIMVRGDGSIIRFHGEARFAEDIVDEVIASIPKGDFTTGKGN